MLALHPIPARPRLTNNLVPTREGRLASRPAATQIISGDIGGAAPWGNRLLVEKQGRLALWTGAAATTDIAPAGRGLQGTNFQALTSDGKREDRLYIADGINPLWYVVRRAGMYKRETIANKIKAASGIAYPIPVAQAVATWRGRLWASYGTNRADHCQFDRPDEWDPLWAVECQGEDPDRILALEPHGKTLIAGLGLSTWVIAGDTQYNWTKDQIASAGVTGANAMVSDDTSIYWISPVGVHQGGQPEPISDDIRDIFSAPPYPAETAIDARRRLLLILVRGRLFVMHLDKPGKFGEITGHKVRGLIQMADYTGWYGNDGAWVLGARDMPDRRLDETITPFTSAFETWTDIPNPGGNGRALLTRTVLVAAGSARGKATYTATGDDNSFSSEMSLTDVAVQRWTDNLAGLDGEDWPTEPVRRELPVNIAGTRFRHRVEAPCHLELHTFTPQYKFGKEEN